MTPTERLIAAARAVHDARQDTYTAGNGRKMGIEADDGEKCYIVHSDQMFELEQAIIALGVPQPPKADEIVAIEISFPVPLKVTDERIKALDATLTEICRDYEAAHPGRIMWPFGHGAKMLVNPLALSDGEPIPFDASVYQIEMAEREAYAGERNAVSTNQS